MYMLITALKGPRVHEKKKWAKSQVIFGRGVSDGSEDFVKKALENARGHMVCAMVDEYEYEGGMKIQHAVWFIDNWLWWVSRANKRVCGCGWVCVAVMVSSW
jgi:hypothetical protein